MWARPGLPGQGAQWAQLYRRIGKWLDGGAFMHAGDPNAPPP